MIKAFHDWFTKEPDLPKPVKLRMVRYSDLVDGVQPKGTVPPREDVITSVKISKKESISFHSTYKHGSISYVIVK